jgi:hypothetical protein
MVASGASSRHSGRFGVVARTVERRGPEPDRALVHVSILVLALAAANACEAVACSPRGDSALDMFHLFRGLMLGSGAGVDWGRAAPWRSTSLQ